MAEFKPPEPEALSDSEIAMQLEGYRQEAEQARRGGLNPRDDKWRDNMDLYWNRFDFTAKAPWQAKEVLPEVPSFVDRFAAALKEALIAAPNGFYNIVDPADEEKDLGYAIKRMTDLWLSTSGRNQNGIPLGFEAVFDEQVKLGALTAMSSKVLWKEDVKGGRVAIETVDPQFVWLDATYRNLYRIHRQHIDRYQLYAMAEEKDGKGDPIWNIEQVSGLVSSIAGEDQTKIASRTGDGQETGPGSQRNTITLDEYYGTILDRQGNVIKDGKDALAVVANGQYLVRGPEKNPFWHQQDWLVFAPLVTVPLSVYGRSYMEDFGSIAKTFTELTNMLLDATRTSAMHAYAIVPSMLINPEQAMSGISPNKTFLLDDAADARQFAAKLDLGTLSPDAFRMWEALKNELREAAGINEIGLGQFAPNSRTSATEVSMTQQSSSALVRSVAQSIETRYLDPVLDRVWKTGLQHARVGDRALMAAVGNEELFKVLISKKKELASHPLTFQARGITYLIQKQSMLQSLLRVMQIVASNENLLQQFLQTVSTEKLMKKLFELSDIDLQDLQLTEREKMMQMFQQMGAGQGQPQPGTPGGQAAKAMGVAK